VNTHGPAVLLSPALHATMLGSGMDDFRRLHDRIDLVCERARGAASDPGVMAEMNDVLSEGYAEALLAEARLMRLEERLADEIATVSPGRADAVRSLANQYRSAEQALAALRVHLSAMHDRFVALGGAPRPA
jgi:hypothetical protein